MAGDSAGGHLALAVSMLSVIRGFKVPEGIVAHYPNLCKDSSRFFPSYLLTLDELTLNEPVRNTFSNTFMKNGGNLKLSPILSPLYAPNLLLKNMKRLRMFVCELDALRDSELTFGQKFLSADK